MMRAVAPKTNQLWIGEALFGGRSYGRNLIITQIMVGATDTISCAVVTAVSVVAKTVCITHSMLSIPDTMTFANEKIFLVRKTIFRITSRSSQALTPWPSFSTPGCPTQRPRYK